MPHIHTIPARDPKRIDAHPQNPHAACLSCALASLETLVGPSRLLAFPPRPGGCVAWQSLISAQSSSDSQNLAHRTTGHPPPQPTENPVPQTHRPHRRTNRQTWESLTGLPCLLLARELVPPHAGCHLKRNQYLHIFPLVLTTPVSCPPGLHALPHTIHSLPPCKFPR
jgi:hypothetical protein